MSGDKGQGFLTVLGLSAVFAVYSLATQTSSPENAKASGTLPVAQQLVGKVELPDTAGLFEGNENLPPTFMGYTCTHDCSGHEAGYEWAEENDITDPDECDGNSDSFVEGCQAYAEEAEESLSDDY